MMSDVSCRVDDDQSRDAYRARRGEEGVQRRQAVAGVKPGERKKSDRADDDHRGEAEDEEPRRIDMRKQPRGIRPQMIDAYSISPRDHETKRLIGNFWERMYERPQTAKELFARASSGDSGRHDQQPKIRLAGVLKAM
jgi:hypothetical protein